VDMNRPSWQHRPNSELKELNLTLGLVVRDVGLRSDLTTGVRILSTTVTFVTAVVSLLVGEENTYTISALKDKYCGSQEQRKYSSAAHVSSLPRDSDWGKPTDQGQTRTPIWPAKNGKTEDGPI
jgi:hypothetical protein